MNKKTWIPLTILTVTALYWLDRREYMAKKDEWKKKTAYLHDEEPTL